MSGAAEVSAHTFAVFTAWSLLQNLKVDERSLFGTATKLEAPRVPDPQDFTVTCTGVCWTLQPYKALYQITAA